MSDNSIKKLTQNSLIYTINGILMKCFSFFLLPLYTAYLTTSDYGIVSITRNFIVPMSFIVSLSLFSAIYRFYVDLKGDDVKLRKFYGTISVFVFVFSTICVGLLTVFKETLIKKVFVGLDFYPIIFITLLTLIFEPQYTIYIQILKSQQKAFKASVVSLSYFLLTVLLNILFVVLLKYNVEGILLSTLIVNVIFYVIFIYDMIKSNQLLICFDNEVLKSALSYSIPIIPHNLSTHIAVLIASILIGSNDSFSALGLYAIAVQFGNIADTIQGYVDSAYGPWLYNQLSTGGSDVKKIIGNAVSILISGIGLAFLGISLFAQDYIFLFLNKAYFDAWVLVPFIVSTYAIKTVYYFYVEVLFYYKDASKKLFVATLSSSVINILLAYFFIPIYGVYGAILANSIAMLVRVSIVIYLSRMYSDIGLRISSFVNNFIYLEIFIILGLAYSYISGLGIFDLTNFIIKCLVVALYIVFMFFRFKEINDIFNYGCSYIKNKIS